MDTSEATESGWQGRASRRRSTAFETEAALVEEQPIDGVGGRLGRWGSHLLVLSLIALPLMFGGVHPTVYAPLEVTVFLLTAALASVYSHEVAPYFSAGTLSRVIFLLGIVFLAYAVVRLGVDIALSSNHHPILGADTGYAAFLGGAAWIREFFFFLCILVSTRTLLVLQPTLSNRLIQAIIVSGCITAFVGLAHWFYDNGRLFWLFEPDNVFISQRARWPFVNSNHLGCFLVPSLFLLIARCVNTSTGLRSMTVSQRTGRAKSFSDLMADERFQKRLLRLTIDGALLLVILLCIIATLSRGVWLGTIIGIGVFLALDILSRPKSTAAPAPELKLADPESRSGRRRSRRHRDRSAVRTLALSPTAWRRLQGCFVAALCVGVYFFLQGRGAELVESRIEYGLLHSKEDMRFQLLADTWPMIAAHPWFGVGVGGWASAHAEIMSPLLAGIVPVYLHNDPIQLLAELGIVGLALAVIGWGVLWIRSTKATFRSESRLTLIAGVAILTATTTATLFDFHLRMPAIVLQLGVLGALIIDLTDRATKNQ
ncbi:MAG: hypothetical protein RL417_976 [Pseudomonadota bacterium]